MADLTDIEAASVTKIVGSTSSGVEQTPIKSSLNGDLGTSDVLDGAGVEGAITVGTSAVAARVGGSNLASRKALSVYNNSNSVLYWGYTNAVTTSTGTPIQKGQQVDWDIGPNATVYLIAGGAGNNVRVTESA